MDKKILILGVLVVLMLVTISFASAVTTNTQTTRKESPLFSIRQGRVRNIVTNYLNRDRIFYIPGLLLGSLSPETPPHLSTIYKRDVNACDGTPTVMWCPTNYAYSRTCNNFCK